MQTNLFLLRLVAGGGWLVRPRPDDSSSPRTSNRSRRLFANFPSHSFCRGSSPNRTRCAGLRFGFGRGCRLPAPRPRFSSLQQDYPFPLLLCVPQRRICPAEVAPYHSDQIVAMIHKPPVASGYCPLILYSLTHIRNTACEMEYKIFLAIHKLYKVILYTDYYNDAEKKIQYGKVRDCEGFLNGIGLQSDWQAHKDRPY